MSLLGRINGDDVGETGHRLPIHQFQSCLYQYSKGELTTADILAEPELHMEEADNAHFNFIIGRIDAKGTEDEKLAFCDGFWHILVLAEAKNTKHTTVSELNALITAL